MSPDPAVVSEIHSSTTLPVATNSDSEAGAIPANEAATPSNGPSPKLPSWPSRLIAFFRGMGPNEWIQLGIAVVLLVTLWVAIDALNLNRQALRQNNLATIYSLSQSTHDLLDTYPLLSKYFDKFDQDGKTDQELRADLSRESLESRIRVQLLAEKLADFIHLTYNQKDVLPAEDWNTWWAYFCDAYDESFVLRDFFDRRPTWYQIGSILKDPEARKKEFR